MIWRSLKDDPPKIEELEGEKSILLFPCFTKVGHLYSVSNPDYALQNALNHGYTHWAVIEPHPDEEMVRRMINEMDWGYD
jgi:hypothetical protein